MDDVEEVASAILEAIVQLRCKGGNLGLVERLKLVSLEKNLRQVLPPPGPGRKGLFLFS